ncbi:BrnT family toxin [Salinarimonas ramus]|uniref:Membrane protein n=1 Tax=Salinarimonas ramus TaxID=690164 RepID=A0A917Q4D1_9HYPH|nr:BrnT family toxin [Salinarimonas ramus]GGK20033.1 membrane protein [Salinarimonas ramus]
MPPTSFEWDDVKAACNEAKHGVSFAEAIAVFGDPWRVVETDARHPYGETRLQTVGRMENRIVFVCYTLRDGVVRVISARLASRRERRIYFEKLGGLAWQSFE